MLVRHIIALVIAIFIPLSSAIAAQFNVDPAHTRLGFSVRHMVISEVQGEFIKFTGSFTLNDDGALTDIKAEIDASSINTRNEKRDGHLKSPDFFDVKNHPKMTFVSKRVAHTGNKYSVVGDLTIKGVTKQIVLSGELLGRVKGFMGESRVGFKAKGKFNRKDFGISFHKLLETGEIVVGDEVNIVLDIEGVLHK